MTILLSIGYVVTFLMIVFMIGLYCILSRTVDDMKKTIHFLLTENQEIRAKQRIFEKRFIQLTKPEKVYFVSDRDDQDLKFGGDGI